MYFTEHDLGGRVVMNYIDAFQNHLYEDGKGVRTIAEYVAAVLALEKWTVGRSDDFQPDQITARDLHDWISFMQTVEKLAPATINKRIAAIKVYWSFLTTYGFSMLNPAAKVKMKRISVLDLSPKWLTRNQQDKLLHQIEKEKGEWKRVRNLAIVQCMLQAGLRISEVASLDIQDIDRKRKTLTVIAGKGGKNRIAFINLDLLRALESWISVRQPVKTSALFLSERGHKRMTRQGIHYLVRKYLDLMALEDLSAHSLRHSFCRNLIDAGQPIQVVAQLAGHENLETTRRYITSSKQDLQNAVERISTEKN